jgi:hypothetical protein
LWNSRPSAPAGRRSRTRRQLTKSGSAPPVGPSSSRVGSAHRFLDSRFSFASHRIVGMVRRKLRIQNAWPGPGVLKNGWGAGTRTPILRSRAACPAIGRHPSRTPFGGTGIIATAPCASTVVAAVRAVQGLVERVPGTNFVCREQSCVPAHPSHRAAKQRVHASRIHLHMSLSLGFEPCMRIPTR